MAPPARTDDERVQRLVRYFEAFTVADLERLREIYVDDASFKDPFNDVASRCEIVSVYRHMFATLDAPRFAIGTAIAQGDECFLTWDFHFRLRDGRPMTVRGGSHLRLAPDGRIAMHRDYWDAAEELYEKLPLLGSLMRWLKRRVNR